MKGTQLDVESCLRAADGYRDLFQKGMSADSPGEAAYWYGEESKKFYNHVLNELEPQNAYASVCLGYLALVRARQAMVGKDRDMALDSAYAKLTQAGKNRKGYAEVHVYLGELYALRKEWGKAIQEFKLIEESGIENSYIHAWWGYVLKQQGNHSESVEHFRKAVELGYPETAASWARRAVSGYGNSDQWSPSQR